MTRLKPLDTAWPVETPEGIELYVHPAGPVLRSVAWLIDLLIRTGAIVALAMLLSLFAAVGIAALLLAWFLINWWYPVFFEVLAGGATPGKKACRLRVVNTDATPVDWGASIVRNLLRQVDALPLGYATGLLAMHCNPRFQRLGDLAAGTLVVYQPDESKPPVATETVEGQPPHFQPTLADQQTLLSLDERVDQLNPERARELAEPLTALTGLSGQDNLARVRDWARWIEGQRP